MDRANTEKVDESDPELEACEAIIAASHKCNNWLKVGTALLLIHETALFKKAGCEIFTDYLTDREELFGFGKYHAQRLVTATKLVKIFPPTVAFPSDELQIQALAGQDPRTAIEVWIKANLISQKADIPLTRKLVKIVHNKDLSESYKAACEDWQDYMSLDSEFYRTPHHIVAAVKRLFGGTIDLDPCSDELAQVGVQSSRFYTAEDDGLQPGNPWAGRVYVFPPMGVHGKSTLQSLFFDRAINEYKAGRVNEVVLLLKAAVGQKWFPKVFGYPHCFLAEKPLKPQPLPPPGWGVPEPNTFAAAYKAAMAALLDLNGDQKVDVMVKMLAAAAGTEGGSGGGGGVVLGGRGGGGERGPVAEAEARGRRKSRPEDGGDEQASEPGDNDNPEAEAAAGESGRGARGGGRGRGGRGGARRRRKSGPNDGEDEQAAQPGDNPVEAEEEEEEAAAGESSRGAKGAGRGRRGGGGRGGARRRRKSGLKDGEDDPGDDPVAEEEAEAAGCASGGDGGAASRGRGGRGGRGGYVRRRSSRLNGGDNTPAPQPDDSHPAMEEEEEEEDQKVELSGGGGDGSGEGGGTRRGGAAATSGRKRLGRSPDGDDAGMPELKLGPSNSRKRKAAAAALAEPVRRRRTGVSWAAEAAAVEPDVPGATAKSTAAAGPGGRAVGAAAMDTAAGTAGAVGGAAQAGPSAAAAGGGANPGDGPGPSRDAPAAAVAPAPAGGGARGGGGQNAVAEAPAVAKEVFNPRSCVVVYIGGNAQRFCEVFSELGYIPGYNSWSLC